MYTNFAYIYDALMYDIEYSKWADYVEEIFKLNGLSPELVVDLGCGTGNFTMELVQRGYDTIGIDISADMLSCAKDKSAGEGRDILYLNQDMAHFELYGTVDAIVSLMDSVNYITSVNDLKSMLRLVRNYLNPGGLFIFDVNTEYKLEYILGNNVFYDIDDSASYIWKNSYSRKEKICEFDLTFFVKEGQYYKKYDEVHYERAYSTEELKALIREAGLEIAAVYDELKLSEPKAKSERIFFVCRKSY